MRVARDFVSTIHGSMSDYTLSMNDGASVRSGFERNGQTSAVSVEKIVDCPFSLAVDQAHVIFPVLETSPEIVRVPYRAFGLPLPGTLKHPVAVRFRRQRDATEPGRSHDEIVFDWSAMSRWLPNFRGVLRFRVESPRTRIVLHGEYVPPFGTLGSLFDRVIGHGLARKFSVRMRPQAARNYCRCPDVTRE